MISAVIITLNEQEHIEGALKSIQGLVDEVIVVDCGSTDEAVAIAKKNKAKTFFRKFDNFSNQKNWAVAKAENEWILSLDADEEISKELALEINQVVKSDNFAGYLISRRNFILGKEIKYSRWSPDKHIWLWQKQYGRWVGEVHEEVKVDGKVGQLHFKKIHNSHKTVQEFFQSNNHYSTLLSRSLFRKGVEFSLWKMLWLPIFEFFIRFFYKLGFMDGWRGFALAYLMAIYQLAVWVKLWELRDKNHQ